MTLLKREETSPGKIPALLAQIFDGNSNVASMSNRRLFTAGVGGLGGGGDKEGILGPKDCLEALRE